MNAKLTITERDGKVDWSDAVIDLDGEQCTLEQIFGAFKSAKRESDKFRELLEWLDRKGGLGLDVHELIRNTLHSKEVVVPAELESATSSVSTRRSNQLS